MFDVNFHGEDHAISGSFGQAQFVGLIVTARFQDFCELLKPGVV